MQLQDFLNRKAKILEELSSTNSFLKYLQERDRLRHIQGCVLSANDEQELWNFFAPELFYFCEPRGIQIFSPPRGVDWQSVNRCRNTDESPDGWALKLIYDQMWGQTG